MSHLTTGEVAKRMGVAPNVITDLFYRRAVDPDKAPIISGRRMIPEEMLFVIEMALKRQGRMPAKGAHHVG